MSNIIEQYICARENGSLNNPKVAQAYREDLLEYILTEIHPYDIYQNCDQEWCTYIRDETRKNHRRRIQSKHRSRLEDTLINLYTNKPSIPTVEEAFEKSLNERDEHSSLETTTIKKYKNVFKRYFTPIASRPISDVSLQELQTFIYENIDKYNMGTKAFNELMTQLNATFDWAHVNGYRPGLVKEELKSLYIPRKKLQNNTNPTSNKSGFSDDEMTLILNHLTTHLDLKNLALLLGFITGLRPGELAALRPSDLQDDSIILHDLAGYTYIDGERVYKNKQHAKTPAGYRTVVLTSNLLWVLNDLRQRSYGKEYCLEENGKRITADSLTDRMYQICDKLGIQRRSCNKLRKNYGSIMCNSDLPRTDITEQFGHTTIDTTYKHYNPNKKAIELRQARLDTVVGLHFDIRR